jgi:murein DD-endopeptidase MepM/ murein hydrolase activator NlpD
MSKADDYNKAEFVAGRLTINHVTRLVERFQNEEGLDVDGFFGPKTRARLDDRTSADPILTLPTFRLASPLPTLADGRRAKITSSFRPKDRPNHVGVDLFYEWRPGDKPDFVGDKGCAGRKPNGEPKWVVPYNINMIAPADGVVQIAGNSKTGYRLWIDHQNGLRSGGFHLLDLKVNIGDVVEIGAPLGLVGDNPADNDGRHLHFELSPVDRYAPIDPAPYLDL